MPRSPDEILAEIAAWPLEERLRLAGRIMEAAAAEIERLKARGAPTAAPTATPPPARASNAASPRLAQSGQQPAARPAAPSPPDPRHFVIVDGSNFLGTVAGFDLRTDDSRDELVMRLQEFARDHPALRVIVYFDGQRVTVKRAGGVEVRFTSGEKPADFFILEFLRSLDERERPHALLVTADRALGDGARKLNAKVEAPSSFHRRLPGVKRTAVGERGLSATEVAAWEDYFQKPPDRGSGPRKR
jgi:hypothetical protein